eukprot:TRINITY_DN103042_c0_g1_i1.p1 TRINITY_DN103042_c0_g1~~TRINITY_DN103042_c0_g1_i1.p1  ORF type:complete len:821 (-),score=174.56 TRINITY_DN103042_c0_g1_i1:80-2479(-)
MGCCSSSATTAGSHVKLLEVEWDGGAPGAPLQGLEVRGVPVEYFLSISGLPEAQREAVLQQIEIALQRTPTPSPGSNTLPVPWRGDTLCCHRPVDTSVLTWNVGGMHDARQSTGAGLEAQTRKDAMDVVAEAVSSIGRRPDIIAVGLQEMISLTAGNAVLRDVPCSSAEEARGRGYGWPETVAQWVELLSAGINSVIWDDDSASPSPASPMSSLRSDEDRPSFGMNNSMNSEEEKPAKVAASRSERGANRTMAGSPSLRVVTSPSACSRASGQSQTTPSSAGGRRTTRRRPTTMSHIFSGHSSKFDVGQRDYALHGQPVYLFGMLLCIFVHKDVQRHVKDFSIIDRPLDAGFGVGSKGVVGCRFVLFDRSFCFLNCHLNAQRKKTRLKQLQQVWNEVKFKSHLDQMVYPVKAHRAVFLLGDLNMRLQKPQLQLSSSDFHSRVLRDIEQGNSSELWRLDQLMQATGPLFRPTSSASISMMQKISSDAVKMVNQQPHILSEFQEALPPGGEGPPFKPTYKLEVPGPGYNKKRVPAWTDRVLYRSRHTYAEHYASLEQVDLLDRNLSDHDPVVAGFRTDCVSISSSILSHMIQAAQELADHPEAGRAAMLSHEQLLFRGAMLQASQQEMEELSRRLFTSLSRFGDMSETLSGAATVLEYQEKFWQLMSKRLEAEIEQALEAAERPTPTNGDEANSNEDGVSPDSATSAPHKDGQLEIDVGLAEKMDSKPSMPSNGRPHLDHEKMRLTLAQSLKRIRESREPRSAAAFDGKRVSSFPSRKPMEASGCWAIPEESGGIIAVQAI